MAPSTFELSGSRPPGRGELLEPVRRASRVVRPRLSHARRLAALTALAVSAPTNARSRRNALRSAQEMAQQRRARPATDPEHAVGDVDTDPERMDVPRVAQEAGRSS